MCGDSSSMTNSLTPTMIFLVGFDRTLILIRGFGNFFLRVAALDRLHHAAHGVELAEVIEARPFPFAA